MAILSRPRLISQQRFDLEDLNALLSALRTDSKLWTKQFLSGENYIVKGFAVTGIGLNSATIVMDQATLIHAENTTDFSYFIAEPAAVNITVADADLTDGTRNYVELKLCTESNTPGTKAFWDPSANGGLGLEFSQQIDTITDLAVDYEVLTGGFSGSADRIPLAIIDTDGSGIIKVILDRRDLFFRLGTPADIDNEFTWSTRQEAAHTLVMSGVSGTFTAGETITIDGSITAEVVTGGTTTITFKLPSTINFSTGDAVVGGTSGATGTVDSIYESFSGADKDIDDFKEGISALQTEFKTVKGTRFWYESGFGSIAGLFQQLNSLLIQESAGAKFYWTGSALSITDVSGAPASADVIASIAVFGDARTMNLTRQDGTGGSTSISISDGELIYVTLPETGTRTFSNSGSGDTNYKTVAVADFEKSDNNYWLAYRSGAKLYVRGLGELEAGEERQISDETPGALKAFLGFDPEIATSIPYTETPSAGLNGQFTTASTLVEAISANTENINDVFDVFDTNSYEEVYTIVAGAPGTGELGPAPVASGTTIPLLPDSRDGNSAETYIVGKGAIEVFLNGQYLTRDVDWEEVGVVGTTSSDIRILRDLEEDDNLLIRQAIYGGFLTSGGGSASLQDAYNNGRTIVVSSGQPVEISGPVSEKLLVINGDIDVTGVIDPKGITFTREASNPLPVGQDGIWFDTNGDAMLYNQSTGSSNLSDVVAGNASSIRIEDTFENNSGATIVKFTPVKIDSSGDLTEVDVALEADMDAVVGVTSEEIADAANGKVTFAGRITNITTAFALGDAVYIDTNGELTNTKPEIGINSFIAGYYSLRVGIIVKNKTNPLQKDLLVRVGEAKEL